jgi:hypothetical protein
MVSTRRQRSAASAATPSQSAVPPNIVPDDSTEPAFRKALPWHIQKQLAEDIEAFGGIDKFKGQDKTLAKQILDVNPTLYGPPADILRERIRKKVSLLLVLCQLFMLVVCVGSCTSSVGFCAIIHKQTLPSNNQH